MKKLISLFYATCVLVLFFVSSSAGENTVVSGQVVDEKNAPVSAAKVYLYRCALSDMFSIYSSNGDLRPGADASSDADGKFRFDNVSPAPDDILLITAAKPGKSFGGSVVYPARWAGGRTDNLRIVLAEPAAVSGKVVDRGGRPIAGVLLTGSATDRGGLGILPDKKLDILTAVSGADGKFVIQGIPQNAQLALTVEADGYARFRTSGPGSTGESPMVKPGDEDVCLTLAPEGKIQGAVVDPVSGKKDSSCALYCYALEVGGRGFPQVFKAVYDTQGDFVFKGLPAGRYTISPADVAASADFTVGEKKDIEVAEGACVKDIKLELVKTGRVAGKVTDAKTGSPLKGARIMISNRMLPSGVSISSGEDGAYKMAVPPGEPNIICQPPEGYQYPTDFGNRKIKISAGETAANVDFTLFPLAKIRGLVVDEAGNPVGGAEVKGLTFSRGGSKTDAQGRFEITGDPSPQRGVGYLMVRNESNGHSALYEIPSDPEASEMKVVLKPSGLIKGKVVNREDKPVAAATVQCRVQSFNSEISAVGTSADTEGVFSVSAPGGGRYIIQAGGPGYGLTTKRDIVLNPGETYDSGSFVLQSASSFIEGRVFDEDGDPAAGVQVGIHGQGQQYRTAVSGKDGAFRIVGLVEGKVNVNAWNQVSGSSYGYLQDVQTGRKDVEIIMQSQQTGGGKIKDITGKPAPALSVKRALGIKPEDIKFGGGKVFVLVAVSLTSPPTKKILPALNDLAAKYQGKDVVIIGLADDSISPEEAQKFIDAGKVNFPLVFSEPKPRNLFGLKIYSDFGVDEIPQVIVVDKKGIVRFNRISPGEIPAKVESLP